MISPKKVINFYTESCENFLPVSDPKILDQDNVSKAFKTLAQGKFQILIFFQE